MSLVQTYFDDNGYDYYGNAAEDTLVFFVHDEDAPTAEEPGNGDTEAITNVSGDTINGIAGGLSPEETAANSETHAEAYQQSGGHTLTNFNISGDNAPTNNENSDASVSGSMSTPFSDTEADDMNDPVPKMAEMDAQQTDTKHSTDAVFKA